MSYSELFYLPNLITIHPFIDQEHLQVKESEVCIQIIGGMLKEIIKCKSDTATSILRKLRKKTYEDRQNILQEYKSLNKKSSTWMVDGLCQSYLNHFASKNAHYVFGWILQQSNIMQQFIYLVDIVQILINNIGQTDEIISTDWIKELFVGSQSYILYQEQLIDYLSQKNKKNLQHNILLNQFLHQRHLHNQRFQQIGQNTKKNESQQNIVRTLKKEKDILDLMNGQLRLQLVTLSNEQVNLEQENQRLDKEITKLQNKSEQQ